MGLFKYVIIIGALLSGCKKDEPAENLSPVINFGEPEKVTITGYDGVIMEPFISRDYSKLFFNNSNSADNTDLYWAQKVNETTFQYMGPVENVNTSALEGVATMDENNNFYFVSTRSYDQDYSTIYAGVFQSGAVLDVSLVEGISLQEPGVVNFDVEVSKDGRFMYMVDGTFDASGGPYTSNFVLVEKNGSTFSRSSESDKILQNINTGDLEYAAGISPDGLELYFTRVEAPISATSTAKIYYSVRNSTIEPFPEPRLLDKANGFVEGPTVSADGQRIYYHKREESTFVLYMLRKS